MLEFINEHPLALLLDAGPGGPPQLQIFDTERGTSMTPIQTSFSLPPYLNESLILCPSLDPCGHIPSPGESMTVPFYPDRSQRILAFYSGQSGICYAINTELLLRLAREREGQDVGWGEWAAHTIEIRIGDPGVPWPICVSGCRLYCTALDEANDNYLRIYDFSHAGRAKYLRIIGGPEGGGSRSISPSLDGYKLPWGSDVYCDAILTTRHDNLVFCIVSILILLSIGSQFDESFVPLCPG